MVNHCEEVYAGEGAYEEELADQSASTITKLQHLPGNEEDDGGNRGNHPATNSGATARQPGEPYVCGHCSVPYGSWTRLVKHFPKHYPGYWPFTCFAKCNQGDSSNGFRRFYSWAYLTNHIIQTQDEAHRAKKELRTKAKDEAIKIMTTGIPEPVKCLICNYTCSSKEELYSHFTHPMFHVDFNLWSCPLAPCIGAVPFRTREHLRCHLMDSKFHSLNGTEVAEHLQTAINNIFAEYSA